MLIISFIPKFEAISLIKRLGLVSFHIHINKSYTEKWKIIVVSFHSAKKSFAAVFMRFLSFIQHSFFFSTSFFSKGKRVDFVSIFCSCFSLRKIDKQTSNVFWWMDDFMSVLYVTHTVLSLTEEKLFRESSIFAAFEFLSFASFNLLYILRFQWMRARPNWLHGIPNRKWWQCRCCCCSYNL